MSSTDLVHAPQRSPEAVFGQLVPQAQVATEVAALARELPAIRARFGEGRAEAQAALAEMSGLLRTSEATAERMAGRPFFKAAWAKLTGREPKEAEEVKRDLARVQARAVCVLGSLLGRREYLEQATRYLGARMELLAMENVKLKAVLVRLGEGVFERFERQDDRLARIEARSDALERRLSLSEVFQSGFSPRLNRPYDDIDDPLVRTLTLAQDFMEASGGDWRPIDLHRLKRLAQGEAQVSATQMLSASEVVERVLALRATGSARLLDWLSADGLQARLMAPAAEAEEARGFYPMHFLLQRPSWFAEQGLPVAAGPALIVQEVATHGLDTTQDLSLWQICKLVLEERLAWAMERTPLTAPGAATALGHHGAHTQRHTLGGPPAQLLTVGARVLALSVARGVPQLFNCAPDAATPIPAQANVQWALGQPFAPTPAGLLTLGRRRSQVVRVVADGPRWRFDTLNAPMSMPQEGLCSFGGGAAVWRREVLTLWDEGGRVIDRYVGRQAIKAAAEAEGGLCVVEGDWLVYVSAKDLTRRALHRLGDYVDPKQIETRGPNVFVRYQQGGEDRLVAVSWRGTEARIVRCEAQVTAMASVDAERALVLSEGALSIWRVGGGLTPLQIPGGPRFDGLARGDGTRFAVWREADDLLVSFEV